MYYRSYYFSLFTKLDHQHASGLKDAALDRSDGNIHGFRDLVVFVAFKVHGEGRSELWGKLPYTLLDLLGVVGCHWTLKVLTIYHRQLLAGRTFHDLLPSLIASDPIYEGVLDDREDPRLDVFIRLLLVSVGKGLENTLLGKVLGILHIPCKAQGEVEHSIVHRHQSIIEAQGEVV